MGLFFSCHLDMFQNSQRIRYDRTPEDERKMMERLQELRSLPTCNSCFQPAPGILAKQGVSEVQNVSRTAVENRLLRLGQPLRNGGEGAAGLCVDACETANGDPCAPDASCAKDQMWKLQHFSECPLVAEETRTTHPPCKYRSMTIDRFDPLCRDPQNLAAIFHPGEINISYRLVAKDNHRPCLPKPMDPTPLLPKESPLVMPPVCPEAPHIPQTFIGSLRPWRHTQDLDVAFGRKEPPSLFFQNHCNGMELQAAMRAGCTRVGEAPGPAPAPAAQEGPRAWEPFGMQASAARW